MKTGVFFKSLRQVPYERIQNITTERNLLHRLLNVTTLQLESASGQKPEALIRVISTEQAKYVHQFIAERSSHINRPVEGLSSVDNIDELKSKPTALFHLTPKQVLKRGLISLKALLPIGILFSYLYQSDVMRKQVSAFFMQFISGLHMELWTWKMWLLYGSIWTLIGLLVLILTSITFAFLRFYDFTLEKRGDRLHIKTGLLTNRQATVPLKRIQLIRIVQSPLHRLFGQVSIKMETAGGVSENDAMSMQWLAPLIDKNEVATFLNQIQPDMDWQNIQWQPVAIKGKRRVFKKLLLFLLIAMIPATYFFSWKAISLLLLVPYLWWYAGCYIKTAAYTHNKQLIGSRLGVFFHHLQFVNINKIQNITWLQSPFDRRYAMARLTIDTAGSNQLSQPVRLFYVYDHEIQPIYHSLTKQVADSRFVW